MTTNKILLIMLLVLITLGAITGLGQFDSPTKRQSNQRKEEPTVLRNGEEPSARQKEHAKLFKHAGRKLQDIASSQPGDVQVIEEEGYVIQTPNSSRVPTFISAVCNADAVVIGTLKSKSSQLTDQGNFIFTDYDLIVDEIIKNYDVSRIEVASTIITTRDGGTVSLNERIFRATKADFEAPEIGKQYLLFLRFIPKTGSYLMYGNGTFELRDNLVSALGSASARELKKRPNQDALLFLNELRSATQADCSKN